MITLLHTLSLRGAGGDGRESAGSILALSPQALTNLQGNNRAECWWKLLHLLFKGENTMSLPDLFFSKIQRNHSNAVFHGSNEEARNHFVICNRRDL